MPTALTNLSLKGDPRRKRWSRSEYESLPTTTARHERLELVDGDLISKMGKKRPHVNALILLQAWLVQVFGVRYVHPEAPIDVAPEDNPSSEPEPDIVVTHKDLSNFLVSNPQPSDILLVVEIADSTLGFDLTAKARLYARAGIAEYWVLDVSGRRMIVHRDPKAGVYLSIAVYQEHEFLRPLGALDSDLRVGEVLPQ